MTLYSWLRPSDPLRRRLGSAWLLTVGFASISCGGGRDGRGIVDPPVPIVPAPAVVSVWIVSLSGSGGTGDCRPPQPFSIGVTKQAYAHAQAAAGNALNWGPTIWSSSDTDVVTVSNTGRVYLVAGGTARITATIGGTTGGVDVTVLPTLIAGVTIYMPTFIVVGDSTQATAQAWDAANNLLTGRTVTWSTNSPSARASTTGMVTGLSSGTPPITATVEGVSGCRLLTIFSPPTVDSVTVNLADSVLVVGATTQATAVARGGPTGGVLTVHGMVTWSSSDTAVATVKASPPPFVASVSTTGVVTAVSAGTAIITATVQGKADSANITVTAPTPP